MKFLKFAAYAVAALSLFASCDKEKEQPVETFDQSISVTLSLPAGLKADVYGVKKELATELPGITDVSIYLLDKSDKILDMKKIDYGTAEWNTLIKTDANKPDGTGGGYKFTGVSSKLFRVVIEANGGTPLTKGANWTGRTITTTLNSNVYMVGDTKKIDDLGKEPFGPTPGTTDADKAIAVKRAKVTIKPIASRFQIVGLQLSNKAAAGTITPNTTAKVIGVVFNRFSEQAVVATDLAVTVAPEKRYSSSAAGFIDKTLFIAGTETGAYKLPLNNAGAANDVTAIAAYLWNPVSGGITINAAEADRAQAKVLAFNFFPQGLVAKTAANDPLATTPKIHLIVDVKGDGSEIAYVNIGSYTTESDGEVTFKPGELYSLNLSNQAEANPAAGAGKPAPPTPVIVDNKKPGETPDISPDLSSDKINLIARLTVAPWTAQNLKPVFDK